MTNNERSAVLKRLVTVLKKNFSVVSPDNSRTPMEQLIYSICLENASFEIADDVYNALSHNYFDWNEVRVSSSRELGETMKSLPEPNQTGLRVKRTLHYIFDKKYAFEIDEIRKLGIKAFNDYMAKMEYVTPFNSAYLLMVVLGRHSIPVSSGEFEVLDILGLLDNKDRENNSAAWLERVVEKKKANEFFCLLHQLAALFVKNPYGRKVQDLLLTIVPGCKEKLPRRRKDEAVPEAAPGADSAKPADSPSTEKTKPGKRENVSAEKSTDTKSAVTKKVPSKPLAKKLAEVKQTTKDTVKDTSKNERKTESKPAKKAAAKQTASKSEDAKPAGKAVEKSTEKTPGKTAVKATSKTAGKSESKADSKAADKTEPKSSAKSAVKAVSKKTSEKAPVKSAAKAPAKPAKSTVKPTAKKAAVNVEAKAASKRKPR